MIHIEHPQLLTPEKYDHYLERGWFRSSFMMYKSEILCINNGLSSIVNIRIDLSDYSIKKRHRKLLRVNDEKFSVFLTSLDITDEAEVLYDQQKNNFQGFIHRTLKEYLFANMNIVPYNTKQIEVREDGKLIALSIIDLGLNSMASILGLYDLTKKEYSLGKYTMLKELEYAKNTGLKWYYPGYIMDQESSFNYKLKFSQNEFLNKNNEWVSFEKFNIEECTAFKIREKTKEIEKIFIEKGIDFAVWYYPYFSFGYLLSPLEGNFLNKALFIEIKNDDLFKVILSYDYLNDLFILEKIWDYPNPERYLTMNASNEYFKDKTCYMTLSTFEILESDKSIINLLNRIL